MKKLGFQVTNEVIEGKKSVLISMEGIVTRGQLVELKQVLIDQLKKNDHMILHYSQPEELDLPFLQLLHALKASVAKQKKTVAFKIEVSKEIKDALESVGFSKTIQ